MGGTFDPKKLLDELSSNQSILELIFDISSKGPKVNQVIKALGPKVVQNIGALHILNVLDNPEYYSKYNSGSNSEQGELEVGEACQRAIFYPEFKTTGKAHLRTYGKEVSPAAIYIGDRILVSCNTIKLPRKIKKGLMVT
ncbi:hypothetical protein ISS05_00065 [Candidatus Woesearchaeota archaeon]|nr:hypothetical protein [Candidatus Woesearchaeota archaeon]